MGCFGLVEFTIKGLGKFSLTINKRKGIDKLIRKRKLTPSKKVENNLPDNLNGCLKVWSEYFNLSDNPFHGFLSIFRKTHSPTSLPCSLPLVFASI
jgi:hypothetical protein